MDYVSTIFIFTLIFGYLAIAYIENRKDQRAILLQKAKIKAEIEAEEAAAVHAYDLELLRQRRIRARERAASSISPVVQTQLQEDSYSLSQRALRAADTARRLQEVEQLLTTVQLASHDHQQEVAIQYHDVDGNPITANLKLDGTGNTGEIIRVATLERARLRASLSAEMLPRSEHAVNKAINQAYDFDMLVGEEEQL